MMHVHRLHRAGRDGSARTFCGRVVQKYENSRREIMLCYSKGYKGFMSGKAQMLAVAFENTAVAPTCGHCLKTSRAS